MTGIGSALVMKPFRQQAELWARARWGWLDDTRLQLVSGLAADVAAIDRYFDDRTIIKSRGSEVWPAAVHRNRWRSMLLDQIDRLDREGKEREQVSPAAQLEAVVAEIRAARDSSERDRRAQRR